MDNLMVLEIKDQRVLTTAQLAEVFRTDNKHISDNFINNKDRYQLEKHFFCLEGDELKAFKEGYPNFSDTLKYTSVLYLWTEKGAWMHAKSLNTDQAWEAYEKLVDDYFRLKQLQPKFQVPQNFLQALETLVEQVKENERLYAENLILGQRVAEYEPKASYVDSILKSKNTVTITQIAKDYGLSGQRLNQILHEEGVQYKINDQWLLYAKHQGRGFTKSRTVEVVHNDGTRSVKMNTQWTQRGRLAIHEVLKQRGIVPMMDRETLEMVEQH